MQKTPERKYDGDDESERQSSSPIHRLGEKVIDWWNDEDRPGIFEFHYFYLPVWMSAAIAAGGTGIWASDEVLGTHFADQLSNVHVEQHDNKVMQTLEEFAQQLGQAAGGHAENGNK